MAKLELTLSQARENAASFMYIFTMFTVNGKPYLNYIDAKHRRIIKNKRDNQRKVLLLSARAYINKNAAYGGSEYQQYVTAVKEGFESTYGMTPQEALIELAKGNTVAGKNWDKGVYGIGALKNSTFKDYEVNGKIVTVDPETGHIFVGTQDVTVNSKTVYKGINGETIAFQLFSSSGDANSGYVTFMSQYNKGDKKYYAQSYSVDNERYDSNGNQISSSDAGSIWENTNFSWTSFVEWLISLVNKLLGIGEDTDNANTIKPGDLLPEQQKDGYTTESGFGEAGMILLALAAGGALLAGGLKKKK